MMEDVVTPFGHIVSWIMVVLAISMLIALLIFVVWENSSDKFHVKIEKFLKSLLATIRRFVIYFLKISGIKYLWR